MIVMNNKATEKLLTLAAQNPELPMMALVYSDVVADYDFNTWWGDIFDVSIEDVWGDPDGDGKTWTKDEAMGDLPYFFEQCATPISYAEVETMSDEDADKAMEKWANSLPWKKYIVLHVDTPDSL